MLHLKLAVIVIADTITAFVVVVVPAVAYHQSNVNVSNADASVLEFELAVVVVADTIAAFAVVVIPAVAYRQ